MAVLRLWLKPSVYFIYHVYVHRCINVSRVMLFVYPFSFFVHVVAFITALENGPVDICWIRSRFCRYAKIFTDSLT